MRLTLKPHQIAQIAAMNIERASAMRNPSLCRNGPGWYTADGKRIGSSPDPTSGLTLPQGWSLLSYDYLEGGNSPCPPHMAELMQVFHCQPLGGGTSPTPLYVMRRFAVCAPLPAAGKTPQAPGRPSGDAACEKKYMAMGYSYEQAQKACASLPEPPGVPTQKDCIQKMMLQGYSYETAQKACASLPGPPGVPTPGGRSVRTPIQTAQSVALRAFRFLPPRSRA